MDILNILGTFVLTCLLIVIPIKWINHGNKNSKKKTKKLIIDQYDPQIYPRLLWCCKNAKLSDLQKRFVLRDKKEIDESWHPQEGVYTLYVEEISTKSTDV